jgi:hypothetical protein
VELRPSRQLVAVVAEVDHLRRMEQTAVLAVVALLMSVLAALELLGKVTMAEANLLETKPLVAAALLRLEPEVAA